MRPNATNQDPQPWWHHGHVWLVLAGPAVVVLASFVTLWLALRAPDPVITGRQAADLRTEQRPAPGLAPALQGRNHAATGGVPAKP